MVHIASGELRELKDCVETLGTVLASLDRLGAGIAAIHVDAAIEQLKSNIVTSAAYGDFSAGDAFIVESDLCAPPKLTSDANLDN